MVNSRHRPVTAASAPPQSRAAWRHPFFRRYGANLPSSLSTDHPRALAYSARAPVSVYGTGTLCLTLRGFSRGSGYPHYPLPRRVAVLSGSGSGQGFASALHRPTPFNALFRQGAAVSLPRHPFAAQGGAGILTGFPSASPFGYTLGPGLPYADERRVGTLALAAGGILTLLNATHACIFISCRSTAPHGATSTLTGTLPYRSPACADERAASVPGLMPDYLRRPPTRPVSCYALFKGWLLLSLPPGCLGRWTSFGQLSQDLRTLADALGCSPRGHGAYPPWPHCREACAGIRSSSGLGTPMRGPCPIGSSTPGTLIPDAARKGISGRTSYLRACLAFHSLPTAHRTVLHHRPVRASSRHYPAFTLAMGRSPGFASEAADYAPCSDSVSLRHRPLAGLSLASDLNLQAH